MMRITIVSGSNSSDHIVAILIPETAGDQTQLQQLEAAGFCYQADERSGLYSSMECRFRRAEAPFQWNWDTCIVNGSAQCATTQCTFRKKHRPHGGTRFLRSRPR